ncbi:PREDICTED: DCN1-like protein 4 isoform X2 [Ipomoea nil]|uniref:DCN1-like protein 4 isoform X2 n=1 Tax=Ipomoea nil TaxID=35883 RepID=UPI000901138D|nr:PREDICTED: DCN1-like protein 4 isoform X2 [Ipomoea nil]
MASDSRRKGNFGSFDSESLASSKGKAASKVTESIDNLFNTYANKSLGSIDPDGVEALCSDLGVDHTDVRVLMLAWKMKAKRQGYFSQDEWQLGLKALQADTITKLKKALPKLEAEVMMPVNFEDFYAFAFRYCLTEDKQKCLDIDSICILVDLVLGSQFRAQVDSFVEYLKSQSDYKVLNMDQWTNFLRFCQEISFPDLQDYDTNQAWPVILDNFVDWMKEKRS